MSFIKLSRYPCAAQKGPVCSTKGTRVQHKRDPCAAQKGPVCSTKGTRVQHKRYPCAAQKGPMCSTKGTRTKDTRVQHKTDPCAAQNGPVCCTGPFCSLIYWLTFNIQLPDSVENHAPCEKLCYRKSCLLYRHLCCPVCKGKLVHFYNQKYTKKFFFQLE